MTESARVEVLSPGATRNGRPYYVVQVVAADGSRTTEYDDENLRKAFEIADHCAVGDVPVIDLVGMGEARH